MAHLRKRNGHLLATARGHLSKDCLPNCGCNFGTLPDFWTASISGVNTCNRDCSLHPYGGGENPPMFSSCQREWEVSTIPVCLQRNGNTYVTTGDGLALGFPPYCEWFDGYSAGEPLSWGPNYFYPPSCPSNECCTYTGFWGRIVLQGPCPDATEEQQNEPWQHCRSMVMVVTFSSGVVGAYLSHGVAADRLYDTGDGIGILSATSYFEYTYDPEDGLDCSQPITLAYKHPLDVGCNYDDENGFPLCLDSVSISSPGATITLTPSATPCGDSAPCGCNETTNYCRYKWQVEWDCEDGFGTPTILSSDCGNYPSDVTGSWRRVSFDGNNAVYEAITIGNAGCDDTGDCASMAYAPALPTPPSLSCPDNALCPEHLTVALDYSSPRPEVCVTYRGDLDRWQGTNWKDSADTAEFRIWCEDGKYKASLSGTVTGVGSGTWTWERCPTRANSESPYCPMNFVGGVAEWDQTGGPTTLNIYDVEQASEPCPNTCTTPLNFTVGGGDLSCGLSLTLSFVMTTADDPSHWTDSNSAFCTISDEGTEWLMNIYDPAGCSECQWFFVAYKADFPDCPPSDAADWFYSGNTEDPDNELYCGVATLSN